jgi:hypothetical protein
LDTNGKKMGYEDAPNDKGELNEPASGYGPLSGKRLQIFHSFEEMERADDLAAANKTPLERIRDTVQLILRVYGVTQEDLNKRKKPRHITITRYE